MRDHRRGEKRCAMNVGGGRLTWSLHSTYAPFPSAFHHSPAADDK